jgi:acetyltransferase-like isoleucine patch superfamily enzyme
MMRAGAGQVRAAASAVDAAVQSARRARLIAAIRAAAFRVHAEVDLTVAPDLWLGRDVRVTIEPHSRNRLAIGSGSRIEDRVLIMLKGGDIQLGPRVELRRDVVVNVAGRLILRGDNPVSWHSVIHCSERVELAEMAGCAEQVTIADSSHYWTTPDEHFWHNVRTGEIYIGRNTWICPKVTLARGAHVGDHCLVASNSVVAGKVPDGSFASGVPATARPMPLPWQEPLPGSDGGQASLK